MKKNILGCSYFNGNIDGQQIKSLKVFSAMPFQQSENKIGASVSTMLVASNNIDSVYASIQAHKHLFEGGRKPVEVDIDYDEILNAQGKEEKLITAIRFQTATAQASKV